MQSTPFFPANDEDDEKDVNRYMVLELQDGCLAQLGLDCGSCKYDSKARLGQCSVALSECQHLLTTSRIC